MVHKIEAVAKAWPGDEAARLPRGQSITYSQLMAMAAAVSTALAASGVSTRSRVALLQEPSALWIASILAVLRIGAVYIPLGLSAPWPRLAAIVKDCRPEVVLVDETTEGQAPQLHCDTTAVVNVSALPLTDSNPNLVPIEATTAGQATILYTSGSTGSPKGIAAHHEAIRNYVESTVKLFKLGRGDVVLQQSTSTFDLSYAQVFAALCVGGCVLPLARRLRKDPWGITTLIASEGVTFTFATPTEYSSWLAYGHPDLLRASKWRTAQSAGEPILRSLVSLFADLEKQDLRLFNTYGPTETCVVATIAQLEYREQTTHLATFNTHCGGHGRLDASAQFRPLPNYFIYVLDQQLRAVPPGVQGEIYIGGAGVSTEGYVNDPSLSSQRFLPDPFCSPQFRSRSWNRMHRTGDLGRWTHSGTLAVEGRVVGDTQVKVRANRVDLQEVEAALLDAAGGRISEAVVALCQTDSNNHDAFLVAYCVLKDQYQTHANPSRRDELLLSLVALPHLPSYMRPTIAIPLSPHELPRTVSGKRNRKAIAALPIPACYTREGGFLGSQEATSPALTAVEA